MIVDGMLQRALPIINQAERLADIEPGDSILWRFQVPGLTDSIVELRRKHPERHFTHEQHDDEVFLVTRLPDR